MAAAAVAIQIMLAYQAARAAVVRFLALLELVSACRATQPGWQHLEPEAAAAAVPALLARTGQFNPAALASPLTRRERACGVGAEAGVGAARIRIMALVLWLGVPVVAAVEAIHRLVQTEQ